MEKMEILEITDQYKDHLTSCPLCKGRIQDILSENYQLINLNWLLTLVYSICEDCHFVFQSTPLNSTLTTEYYRIGSPRYRSTTCSSSDKILHREQAEFMNNTSSLFGTNVLDIGADMGGLLDVLADDYNCITWFDEQNISAREQLAKSKHREYNYQTMSEKLDWIILSQVLEHISSPVPWLRNLIKILKPSGHLFIEVPHHGAWDDKDYGLSYEHVNYFSAATLISALDKAGYIVLGCKVLDGNPRYFSGCYRIIRVSARPKSSNMENNLQTVIVEHHKKVTDKIFKKIKSYLGSVVKSEELALYGAGELCGLFLSSHVGDFSRLCIFDSDKQKHGCFFHGLKIKDPFDLLRIKPEVVVILSGAESEIKENIQALGYKGKIVCWSEL